MYTNKKNTDNLLSIFLNVRDKTNMAIDAINESNHADMNMDNATKEKKDADIKLNDAVNTAIDTVSNVSIILADQKNALKPSPIKTSSMFLNNNVSEYPILYKTQPMPTQNMPMTMTTQNMPMTMPTQNMPMTMPTQNMPMTMPTEEINTIIFNLNNLNADNSMTKEILGTINKKGVFSQLEISGMSMNQNQNQYNFCSSLVIGIMRNDTWLIKQALNIAQDKSNINFTITSSETIMLEESDKVIIELITIENCKTEISDITIKLYLKQSEQFTNHYNKKNNILKKEQKIWLLIVLFIMIMIIILLNKCKK